MRNTGVGERMNIRMDKELLRTLAGEMGLANVYDKHEGFAETFAVICKVVEKLPPHLIEQGRELPYPQLHWATRNGDLPMVVALLAAGADQDAFTHFEDEEDESPMFWLANSQGVPLALKKKITLAFIGHDAHLDAALAAAEDNGDSKFADFLRKHGAED